MKMDWKIIQNKKEMIIQKGKQKKKLKRKMRKKQKKKQKKKPKKKMVEDNQPKKKLSEELINEYHGIKKHLYEVIGDIKECTDKISKVVDNIKI